MLRQLTSALTTTIAVQEANLRGRAEQKDREEAELETVAHRTGQALAAYLEDKGREGEASEFDISLSRWQGLRDTALLAKATLLKNRLRNAIDNEPPDQLSTYGIVEQQHTDLDAELEDYKTVIESPSGGIATRKALTAAEVKPMARMGRIKLPSQNDSRWQGGMALLRCCA